MRKSDHCPEISGRAHGVQGQYPSGLGSTAPVFSDHEVLLLLRAAIKREGSQAAFAKRCAVDRVYLSMVLSGRRPVGSTIAKALGLRKAYVAESINGNVTTTPHPGFVVPDQEVQVTSDE